MKKHWNAIQYTLKRKKNKENVSQNAKKNLYFMERGATLMQSTTC